MCWAFLRFILTPEYHIGKLAAVFLAYPDIDVTDAGAVALGERWPSGGNWERTVRRGGRVARNLGSVMMRPYHRALLGSDCWMRPGRRVHPDVRSMTPDVSTLVGRFEKSVKLA